MFRQLGALMPGIDHREEVEQRSLYFERARYAWLIEKIRQMKLVHSKLTAEAEDRVCARQLTWSQMIFTDLFGPDAGVIGQISERLSHLERNLAAFSAEAVSLHRLLTESGFPDHPV